MRNKLRILLVSVGAVAALHAAPKLRLTTTTVGPIAVAQGSNGTVNPNQVPYAYNIGDGTLNLKASSSDSWLVATLGTATPCTSSASCIPVQLSLQTSSLAKGSYTGFVTLTDPNAVDSPQTISVTVNVGGSVPDQITLYAPPGGTATTNFTTGANAQAKTTTQSGGSWLSVSVAANGLGSFSFSTTFTVTGNAASLSAGDYNGSVAVSNSNFSGDNKTVPVVFHVTTNPIGQPTSSTVQLQIAQGATKQTFPIVLTNTGQGTLTVSGATVATTSGGNWLTSTTSGNVVTLTADRATLAPGKYQGTVTINSNAANGTQTIPVQLTVSAAGPPAISYGGVVNVFTNLSTDGLSQGDVVAVYGTQFTPSDAQVSNLPLTTTFASTQVLINGNPVPVQYVSANQVNIQIPYDATVGDGTLQVISNGQKSNTVSVHIAPAAAALLPFQGTQYVLAQTASGGYEGYLPSVPAHRGDTVVMYAVGLGATNPSVTAGTAAPTNPLATVSASTKVCLGQLGAVVTMASCTTPQFAGLTPGFFGLYQINYTIPSDAQTGSAVPIFLEVGDSLSNMLVIAIQ